MRTTGFGFRNTMANCLCLLLNHAGNGASGAEPRGKNGKRMNMKNAQKPGTKI